MTDENTTEAAIKVQLDQLKYDEKGLVPVIVQDAFDHRILMFAFMNQTSLLKTIQTKSMVYYSRSRQSLWKKGETSGHTQTLRALYTDCDHDVLLAKVVQKGDLPCHTNRRSCFYNVWKENTWQVFLPIVDENTSMEDARACEEATATSILPELEKVIDQRLNMEDASASYVASLMKKGMDQVLKKVGEESAELIIAGKGGGKDEIIYEAADLLFHMLILLRGQGVSLDAVESELKRRFGLSGIDEKNARLNQMQ